MGALSVTITNKNHLPEGEFNDLCKQVYDEIVAMTPVDTGACQNGWTIAVDGDHCEIENPVPYTSFLEEGHSSQAPNGMVQVALDQVPELSARIKTIDLGDDRMSQKAWTKLRNAQIRIKKSQRRNK